MATLTVLVPIYNETEWFASGSFTQTWDTLLSEEAKTLFFGYAHNGICLDLRFCLWPSQDDSLAYAALEQYCTKLPETIAASIQTANDDTLDRDNPSIVASLELGLTHAITSPLVMICPVDCALSTAGWSEILDRAEKIISNDHSNQRRSWGVFPKRYAGEGVSLSLRSSAWLQNALFAPILGIHCWTNLFVIPRAKFGAIFERQGFLEDLRANQRLMRQCGRPHRFASLALVSPRRYMRRGPLNQMRANVGVYVRYILGRYESSATHLRHLHEGTKSEVNSSAL